MTLTTSVNYKDLYFEHPTLTKIPGEPSYATLHTLTKELKANASSVPSTLGGGNHGYLGLVLSAANYALLTPNTPFLRPAHPGPLIALGTGPAIAHATSLHKRAEKEYLESILIERTLIQQIVDAVEPKYLQEIRHEQTGAMEPFVHRILAHLTKTYGSITAQQLADQRNIVETMVYDPNQPIDVIFEALSSLQTLYTAASTAMPPAHLINIALIVLTKQRIFKDEVRLWQRRDVADQTWTNFKTAFRQAHIELRASGGTIGEDLGYHNNGNAAIEQLLAHMEVREATAAATIERQTNLANATQANMTTQLQTMMQQITDLQQQQPPDNNNRGRGRNNGRGQGRGNNRGRERRNTNERNNPNERRNNGGRYCWSHGNCYHTSTQCTNQKDGHQTTATFQATMGGSTHNCDT